jgi:uracil-DNA glycosylase
MINKEILPKEPYYPEAADIFRVFAMPLDKIKVVILGQDPYSRGEANGFAFAVKESVKVPPSLEVIREEIIRSKVERDTSVNIESDQWKTLKHWRQQGVFLLNTALTVKRKEPGSHTGIWEWFTREVIRTIADKVGPVWLLWGARAQSFELFIATCNNHNNNVIIKGYHPAAQTRPENKDKYPFVGNNHFTLCNKALKERNQTIVNW